MQEESSNDLFGIRLNEVGIYYIRKAASLGLIIFSLLAIGSLLTFIRVFKSIYLVFVQFTGPGDWKTFGIKVISCMWCLIITLNLFGIFYFAKFLRSLGKSVNNTSEQSFNLSFRYIYVNAIIFTWLFALNLIFEIYAAYYRLT